ncbi:MAG: cohesin domain-containing protein, partial [bacterium]|nr:cohesin domain-containing protein [bacterium]
MKKFLPILIVSTLIFAFFPAPPAIAQEGASIYLSPSNGTFNIGTTFSISIFVNTGGKDINAIKVNLKFDPKMLQVSSPTAGRSFVSVWLSQPAYSNTEGTLSFQGGVPTPGINTSSGLISTIVFRVISPGTTSISVSDAAVYLNDGQGTDILNSIGRGIYDLTLPPPEGPQIFSSTHPDQNKWYKNNNPTLNWEREEGVTGFSHSIDKDFQGVPDNISEGLENAVSYDNLGDGIWYFHVKAEKGNIWGGISHYVLNIDTT